MSRFLRIAMAWLLLAALPIQGYAAHAMLFCASAHHHPHQGQSACEPAELAPDHGAAAGCSVCASCCAAVAITAALPAIDVMPAPAVIVATIPSAHERVLIGGLERPPRTPGA